MTFIRQTAIAILARREHSVDELCKKLQHKKYHESEIQLIILDLIAKDLLSDDRFTESFIRAKRLKGAGPLRILFELRKRGISEDLIEHHLKITDNMWLTEVRRVWQKRFKSPARDAATRAKQMRFLQYRGFTQEQIEPIFKSSDS